jgi:hypothetical protein
MKINTVAWARKIVAGRDTDRLQIRGSRRTGDAGLSKTP